MYCMYVLFIVIYSVCVCIVRMSILLQYTHIRISWASTYATVPVFLPVFRVEPRGGGLIYPPYLRVRYSTTSDVSSGTVQVCLYVCGGLVCTYVHKYIQYIRMYAVCTYTCTHIYIVDV